MTWAIPLPICLHMVVGDWSLRSVCAERAFRILTLYASIVVLAPLLSEKLLACDGRKSCQMLRFVAAVAFEDVLDAVVLQDKAPGTFCSYSVTKRIDQMLFQEMILWPSLLGIFTGASFPTACEPHCQVDAGSTFGRSFAGALFADDLLLVICKLPSSPHVCCKIIWSFQSKASVARDDGWNVCSPPSVPQFLSTAYTREQLAL